MFVYLCYRQWWAKKSNVTFMNQTRDSSIMKKKEKVFIIFLRCACIYVRIYAYVCVPDVVSVLSSTKIYLPFRHRTRLSKNTYITCIFYKKEVIVKPRTFLFLTFIFIVPVIRLTCKPRTFLLSFNKNEWNYRWRIKWSTKPNLTSHAYLSWNYFWFIFLLVAMFMVMVLMANTLMHIWNDD